MEPLLELWWVVYIPIAYALGWLMRRAFPCNACGADSNDCPVRIFFFVISPITVPIRLGAVLCVRIGRFLGRLFTRWKF